MIILLEFLESQLFANICSAFAAIGTVGAVIISIYLILRDNKVKYKMTANTIDMINPINNQRIVSGYGINIVNLSYNQNIMLKQSMYVYCSKKETLLLLINMNLPKEYITPNVLYPGEDFTFVIEKEQIKEILNKSNNKKIKFYFMDKSNIKYTLKLKRTILEEFLNKK